MKQRQKKGTDKEDWKNSEEELTLLWAMLLWYLHLSKDTLSSFLNSFLNAGLHFWLNMKQTKRQVKGKR